MAANGSCVRDFSRAFSRQPPGVLLFSAAEENETQKARNGPKVTQLIDGRTTTVRPTLHPAWGSPGPSASYVIRLILNL